MSKWEVVQRLHCEAARCLPWQQTRKDKFTVQNRVNLGKIAPQLYKSLGSFERLVREFVASAGIQEGFAHLLRLCVFAESRRRLQIASAARPARGSRFAPVAARMPDASLPSVSCVCLIRSGFQLRSPAVSQRAPSNRSDGLRQGHRRFRRGSIRGTKPNHASADRRGILQFLRDTGARHFHSAGRCSRACAKAPALGYRRIFLGSSPKEQQEPFETVAAALLARETLSQLEIHELLR
jgi:hypothetical protein